MIMMNVCRSTLLALLVFSQLSYAVKMDETTHDVIIDRLEMAISNMEKKAPERPGVLARLADLYADRARIVTMNRIGGECKKDCKDPVKDRARAINLYNEALSRLPRDRQGKVTLQVAHLHNLNGQSAKAIQLYNHVIRSSSKQFDAEAKALANAAVGEIHFRKGEFVPALRHLNAARVPQMKNRGLVEYRIAWCHLNMGKTDLAIDTMVKLLSTPALLATQTSEGRVVDASFVQDASNDLARFLARTTVTHKEIQTLRNLSPDNARKLNLHTLASETDRLGKKVASLTVWDAYLAEEKISAGERLEVQARVAQIYYDLNRLGAAAEAFGKALELRKRYSCKDEVECEELQTRLRRFVTVWHRAQKREPTVALFQAYVAYVNVFREDVEMLHWAAQIGSEVNRPKEAADLFHRASLAAIPQIKKNPKDQKLIKIFEGSLLGEIEMAEASKDSKTRETAYDHYLNVNPNGSQATQVRYQRAQLYYKNGRTREALNEFNYLATQGKADNRDLRVKSADLALDALVALKDDKALQLKSLEYARIYNERKTEYMKISRKATMNIVANQLKDESSTSRSQYRSSLETLNRVQMDGADDAEKIRFFKNKLVIAQKAMELDAVSDSADQLLRIKSLNADDREWAMAQKVWVAELQLNFTEAYQLTRQMKLDKMSKADRELRLALLAELAGINSRPHNEAYIKLAGNTRAANLVRVTLIKASHNPWHQLDQHLRSLRQHPDILAGLALELFARQKDYNRANGLIKTTGIVKYPAGQTLARQIQIRDFNTFELKIRSHRLHAYNEQVMQNTLKERLKLISQSERAVQEAIKKRDWTMQILTLTQLSRENRRLYDDINKLPVPRRLNPQQRQQYMQLIQTQSAPYLAKAERIQMQLNEMWNNSASMQNLQSAYMSASPELQKIYRDEINELARRAPSSAEKRLNNLLNTPFRKPSERDLMYARKALQNDPLNISKAQELRKLESQSGRDAMVVYLDERIAQIKKGKSL